MTTDRDKAAEIVELARDKANESPYVMVQVSPRRYSIVKCWNSPIVYGTADGTARCYGVKRAEVIEDKMTYSQAISWMRVAALSS